VNSIALRIASFFAACLVAVSALAAGPDTPAGHKGADSAAMQGGGAHAAPSIAVEEDREGNEVPPPAPSGDERRLIGDHIRDHTREINSCYERRAQERKALHGKLIARFDIGPNGRVIGVTADGMDDRELALCIVKVVRAWTFARPRSSVKLRVAYPWVFPPSTSQ
jgi:outer membrane biosynthesis protein TonB